MNLAKKMKIKANKAVLDRNSQLSNDVSRNYHKVIAEIEERSDNGVCMIKFSERQINHLIMSKVDTNLLLRELASRLTEDGFNVEIESYRDMSDSLMVRWD